MWNWRSGSGRVRRPGGASARPPIALRRGSAPRRAGRENAPPGWLIDAEGVPTCDPSLLFAEPPGALLPAGGHKGYALSLAVDVVSGILSGGGFSRPEPGPDELNGMFILALDVAWFLPQEEFRTKVDQLTAYVKSSKPLPGGTPVQIPGEPDREEAARRSREGIPLNEQTLAKVARVLTELGLSPEGS